MHELVEGDTAGKKEQLEPGEEKKSHFVRVVRSHSVELVRRDRIL